MSLFNDSNWHQQSRINAGQAKINSQQTRINRATIKSLKLSTRRIEELEKLIKRR